MSQQETASDQRYTWGEWASFFIAELMNVQPDCSRVLSDTSKMILKVTCDGLYCSVKSWAFVCLSVCLRSRSHHLGSWRKVSSWATPAPQTAAERSVLSSETSAPQETWKGRRKCDVTSVSLFSHSPVTNCVMHFWLLLWFKSHCFLLWLMKGTVMLTVPLWWPCLLNEGSIHYVSLAWS